LRFSNDNSRRDIENQIIDKLDSTTFNDVFNKSFSARNFAYFMALLRGVTQNERERYTRMYDEYTGPRIEYPDLPLG
jgi:hypothetical protein